MTFCYFCSLFWNWSPIILDLQRAFFRVSCYYRKTNMQHFFQHPFSCCCSNESAEKKCSYVPQSPLRQIAPKTALKWLFQVYFSPGQCTVQFRKCCRFIFSQKKSKSIHGKNRLKVTKENNLYFFFGCCLLGTLALFSSISFFSCLDWHWLIENKS